MQILHVNDYSQEDFSLKCSVYTFVEKYMLHSVLHAIPLRTTAGVLNLARTPKLLAGEFLKLAGEVFSKKITTAVVIFLEKSLRNFPKKSLLL